MKRILIAGDSFSSVELAGDHGWATMLTKNYSVTNVSQPGIGEYKILKNLESQDLNKFDTIIVSHTSPNRIHCELNPLYPVGHIYHTSDLLFGDVESKVKNNQLAKSVYDYFVHVFDPKYYEFVHASCCEKIDKLTQPYHTIHMTNFDWNNLYKFPDLINFYSLWTSNKGPYAHYNIAGNQVIFDTLCNKLSTLYR